MGTFVKAATFKDIQEGSMKHVQIKGTHITLARIGSEVFAFDDTCTHEHCSLGEEGFLDGTTVTCGCHGAQFDIVSGKVLALPATHNLGVYKTKIVGADIFVEM